MTYTTIAKKDQLQGLFFPESLTGSDFKVTITPISSEEVDDVEFHSLKGIAGRELDLDEIRRERLGI